MNHLMTTERIERPIAGSAGRIDDCRSLVLALLIAAGCSAQAEVFKCTAASGKVTYQDAPCAKASAKNESLEIPGPINLTPEQLKEKEAEKPKSRLIIKRPAKVLEIEPSAPPKP